MTIASVTAYITDDDSVTPAVTGSDLTPADADACKNAGWQRLFRT